MSEISRLDADTVLSDGFREQPVDTQTARVISGIDAPGEYLAVYWLESGFGEQNISLSPEDALAMRKRWERADGWIDYLSACQAVWNDLVYFPVALSQSGNINVSFEDSWMFDRSYKGIKTSEVYFPS